MFIDDVLCEEEELRLVKKKINLEIGSMPFSMTYNYSVMELNDELYVVSQTTFYKLGSDGAWTQLCSLPNTSNMTTLYKGNIYTFITNNYYIYNVESDKWVHNGTGSFAINSNYLTNGQAPITVHNDRIYWMYNYLYGLGLYSFDGVSVLKESTPPAKILHIVSDGDNLYGLADYKLYKYDGSSWTVIGALPSNVLFSFLLYKDSMLYLYMNNYILQYDIVNATYYNYLAPPNYQGMFLFYKDFFCEFYNYKYYKLNINYYVKTSDLEP